MDYIKKKEQLEAIIKGKITPLIDRDYVLLSLPFHSNIGDTLIYEGECDFLSELKYNCLLKSSVYDFDERDISKDSMIIFHGGGNFGDIYTKEENFKNSIIEKYSNRRIVFFPQTVFYQKEENLKNDVSVFSKCHDLTICVRDKKSYDILVNNFVGNKILLVPDMAFYINRQKLKTCLSSKKIMFLKRTDEEYNDQIHYSNVPEQAEIRDWPTYEKNPSCYHAYSILRHIVYVFGFVFGPRIHTYLYNRYIRFFWTYYLLPYNVKCGVKFINSYDTIYTTRLHGAILAVLLGKKVFLYDNKYGKIASYYDTWLRDLDIIKIA